MCAHRTWTNWRSGGRARPKKKKPPPKSTPDGQYLKVMFLPVSFNQKSSSTGTRTACPTLDSLVKQESTWSFLFFLFASSAKFSSRFLSQHPNSEKHIDCLGQLTGNESRRREEMKGRGKMGAPGFCSFQASCSQVEACRGLIWQRSEMVTSLIHYPEIINHRP